MGHWVKHTKLLYSLKGCEICEKKKCEVYICSESLYTRFHKLKKVCVSCIKKDSMIEKIKTWLNNPYFWRKKHES
jgi:uncharacterized protein CbrC (UPF0167 family)